MPFLVDADTATLGVTYTVPQLCTLMGQVHHPLKIGFPYLRGQPVDLGTSEESPGPVAAEGVRCFGLITCAAVIYSNAAGTAFYVIHSLSGVVDSPEHLRAVNALGGNAANLYVAYGHPKDLPGYAESLQKLVSGQFKSAVVPVNQRIPDAQAVRIKNLANVTFGLNGYGWLGY